jgi:hypothetical protein
MRKVGAGIEVLIGIVVGLALAYVIRSYVREHLMDQKSLESYDANVLALGAGFILCIAVGIKAAGWAIGRMKRERNES